MSSARSASLRRSRRAPKKFSEYQVGDIVEFKRSNNTVAKARLAQLLTQGTVSVLPRWLLKFDGQAFKDEEVYEKALGKVLQRSNSSSGEEDTASALQPTSRRGSPTVDAGPTLATTTTTVRLTNSPVPSTSISNSNSKGVTSSSNNNKATTSNSEDDEGLEDGSKATNNSNSAREERVKRRTTNNAVAKLTAKSAGNNNNKRKGAFKRINSNSSGKKYKLDANEVVTKVKLLTGTLFLYTSGNRKRAEFVRRV